MAGADPGGGPVSLHSRAGERGSLAEEAGNSLLGLPLLRSHFYSDCARASIRPNWK